MTTQRNDLSCATKHIPTDNQKAQPGHAAGGRGLPPHTPSFDKMPDFQQRNERRYITWLHLAALPSSLPKEKALCRFQSPAYLPIHGCWSNPDTFVLRQTEQTPRIQTLLTSCHQRRHRQSRLNLMCFSDRILKPDNLPLSSHR